MPPHRTVPGRVAGRAEDRAARRSPLARFDRRLSYIKYGVDFDGNGHVDLRHSIPDVLASTANLLHTSGFKGGAPYGEGTANFEAMREWNRATIYRKTIGYFADRLVGR